ncbi:LSm family protein [Aquimarina agarilytica]|uniref:hypothetical protein n=1 Tax=Aquimarina agarilytica TaxID=1087449 RepID=UPI000289F564|nr:hypothetical protein [Aquimarina agarilytica]
MERVLVFSFLFISFIMSAQERVLSVTNEIKNKTIEIKEGKRIRVKTFDGKKISGRLKFVDAHTIMIKKTKIPLTQIKKIKKNPLLMTVPMSTFFGTHAIYSGVGGLILVAQTPFLAPILFFTIPTGAILGYIAMKPPNILKGYKASKKWKYQINLNN